MEQALLLLPFHTIGPLLAAVLSLVERGREAELCAKVALFVLRSHAAQLSSTHMGAQLAGLVGALGQALRLRLGEQRLRAGRTLAGLKLIDRAVQKSHAEREAAGDLFTAIGTAGKKSKIDDRTDAGKKKRKTKSVGKQGQRTKRRRQLTMAEATLDPADNDD